MFSAVSSSLPGEMMPLPFPAVDLGPGDSRSSRIRALTRPPSGSNHGSEMPCSTESAFDETADSCRATPTWPQCEAIATSVRGPTRGCLSQGAAMMPNMRSGFARGRGKQLVAETEFSVIYDGDLVREHSIPVRDLAPALLALGELFSEANRIIHPLGVDVRLEVKATDTGSFDLHLILKTIEDAERFLSGDVGTSLANLTTIVIGPTTSILALIAWLRRRKRGSEEPSDDPNTVRFVTEDGDSLEVPRDVAALYDSLEVRKLAREAIIPIERDGIDTVEFKRAETTIRLTKDDAASFEVEAGEAETETLQATNTGEYELRIENVPLESPDAAWRFNDGDRSFRATMLDEGFVRGIENRTETFASGDILRAVLRHRQYRSSASNRRRNEYAVLEVRSRVQADPPSRQLSLGDGAESPSVTDVEGDVV